MFKSAGETCFTAPDPASTIVSRWLLIAPPITPVSTGSASSGPPPPGAFSANSTAIFVPSGDHCGSVKNPVRFVSFFAFPPLAAGTTKSCGCLSSERNAIRDPSGDHAILRPFPIRTGAPGASVFTKISALSPSTQAVLAPSGDTATSEYCRVAPKSSKISAIRGSCAIAATQSSTKQAILINSISLIPRRSLALAPQPFRISPAPLPEVPSLHAVAANLHVAPLPRPVSAGVQKHPPAIGPPALPETRQIP